LNPHEPAPHAGPFIDALVGLASMCRRFDRFVTEGHAAHLLIGEGELLDALVGLCSLHHTLDAVIEAMCGDPCPRPPFNPATWRRDVLR
jgi:hypothetical protein